jgi:Meckel syndrome type 1 protein
MSQGNDYANYAASDEARNTASEDVWFVAVATDDIKQMTVDQLDEAFRLGVISAQTQVWTEGMEAWAPLGEVADLDAADAASGSSAADDDEETSIARTEYESPAQQAAAHGFATASAQAGSLNLQSSQGGFAAGPSSYAPVTSSVGAGGHSADLGRSTGPVALNLDEDMPPIRHGRRFRPERWLLAAAAVAGIGVTAYNNSDIFGSSAAVASTTASSSSTALAARPYEGEPGAGVERGASLGAAQGTVKADSDEAASKAAAVDSAPVGDSTPSKASEEDDAPDSEPAVAQADAPAKDSLKGSFSKAFNKKAVAAKPAKASKPVKARKTASRATSKPAKASKKAGVTRAASAFDPLNASLP